MNRRFMFKSLVLLFFTIFVSSETFAKNDINNFIEVNEKNKVCMVNNFYNPMADFTEFEVNVEKKSYYGCCAMCKDKLKMSSQHRIAIDPLSKEKVSKADAYIVADKTNKGKTYYFKNKTNFIRWTKL